MEPIIHKVNNTFESLKALESVANLATKVNKFAFSRIDSNLIECRDKLPFIILQYIKDGEWPICVAKCPEALIVDSTYKTNICKYSFVSAISINNISNKKGILVLYQIAIAWIENKSKTLYIWLLQTLYFNIYDAYNCLPNVFISDRDQALQNAAAKMFLQLNEMLCLVSFKAKPKTNWHKLFENDNNYELFKKEVKALHFTSNKKNF
ncbi:7903_t:CDS:2 [Dentiscutata erythropus]|uniref:7903_t:CDS:1 n=1 Tax=Dentiscutata erythropus TaxID=1348616 RepID=A0A9N9HIB8_9GLOM|nr:7903_t:CDS:2 [Dentiscutata erythropus]